MLKEAMLDYGLKEGQIFTIDNGKIIGEYCIFEEKMFVRDRENLVCSEYWHEAPEYAKMCVYYGLVTIEKIMDVSRAAFNHGKV